jgi:hypothetical protein
MDGSEIRKIWRRWVTKFNRVLEEERSRDLRPGTLEYPRFPPECYDLTCGAKTRKGTPCKLKAIYASGRCKFHGGLSTGPRTTEGKAKSALNGKRPKKN